MFGVIKGIYLWIVGKLTLAGVIVIGSIVVVSSAIFIITLPSVGGPEMSQETLEPDGSSDPSLINSEGYNNALEAAIALAEMFESYDYKGLEGFVGQEGVAITEYFYQWSPPGHDNTDELILAYSRLTIQADPVCEFIAEGTLPEDHYFVVMSNLNIISVFGREWEGSMLVMDVRADNNGNYILAAMGPFTLRQAVNDLPSQRYSCDGGELSHQQTIEEFADEVRYQAENGLTGYLYDTVYLRRAGGIGGSNQHPLAYLEGYVDPEDAQAYVSSCLDVLADISTLDQMSGFGFNPNPIYDQQLLEEAVMPNIEFFFEWGMNMGSERAYARLLLGVMRYGLDYKVVEAHCYPYVQ
jgi:hypothetical protein